MTLSFIRRHICFLSSVSNFFCCHLVLHLSVLSNSNVLVETKNVLIILCRDNNDADIILMCTYFISYETFILPERHFVEMTNIVEINCYLWKVLGY